MLSQRLSSEWFPSLFKDKSHFKKFIVTVAILMQFSHVYFSKSKFNFSVVALSEQLVQLNLLDHNIKSCYPARFIIFWNKRNLYITIDLSGSVSLHLKEISARICSINFLKNIFDVHQKNGNERWRKCCERSNGAL